MRFAIKARICSRHYQLTKVCLSVFIILVSFKVYAVDPGAPIDCDTSYQDCVDAAQTAMKACTTPDLAAGMSQQQAGQAQQLQQQANAANQNVAGSGASQTAQCKNQADLSKILSALSALKGGACLNSVSDCQSTCEAVTQACLAKAKAGGANAATYSARARSAQQRDKQCGSLTTSGVATMAQAGVMMAAMFQNDTCAAATAAATPTPSPSDCSNPTYAQATPACICAPVGSNPFANPKSSMCAGASNATGINPALSSGGGATTPTVSAPPSSEGVPVAGDPGKPKAGNTGNATVGEGGGGGFSGGNGGGKLNATGDGGGSGPSSIDKNVITGQSGGGGGAAGGGSGGGSAGSGGDGTVTRGANEKIDLSQFMPRNQYKAQGLGGMSIPAKDGITGPMGPSIWEKVSNQYQIQKPRMIQDR